MRDESGRCLEMGRRSVWSTPDLRPWADVKAARRSLNFVGASVLGVVVMRGPMKGKAA